METQLCEAYTEDVLHNEVNKVFKKKIVNLFFV